MQPFELPQFYMPYPARLNLNLEEARAYSKDWARRIGMLDTLPGVPGGFIWDDHKFDVADVALCGTLIHLYASGPELNVTVCWLVWGTYADDYFPALYGYSRSMSDAKVFNARLTAFMPLNGGPTLPPTNPVERGLADLWLCTAVSMSIGARRQFRQAIMDMIESWLWELANQSQNRILDPVDYVEMRRKTFGSDVTLSEARQAQGDVIPPEIYRTRTIQGLENSAQDDACLTNDVFSYQKEVELEGEFHNGVLVVRRFLDCDHLQFVKSVNDLMTSQMQQFEHLIATELPVLFEDFDLDTDAREKLLVYIEKLQHWMAGILRWHITVDRCKEVEFHDRSAARQLVGKARGMGILAA